jgi:transposase-like protein
MSPPSDCRRNLSDRVYGGHGVGRSMPSRQHHEGFWSLLRSWLRSHRGISQDKLPLYLGFFQFVHNARRRGKALLGALVAALVA